MDKQIQGQKKKMNIPEYETKVPADVREANAQKLNLLELEFSHNEASLQELKNML